MLGASCVCAPESSSPSRGGLSRDLQGSPEGGDACTRRAPSARSRAGGLPLLARLWVLSPRRESTPPEAFSWPPSIFLLHFPDRCGTIAHNVASSPLVCQGAAGALLRRKASKGALQRYRQTLSFLRDLGRLRLTSVRRSRAGTGGRGGLCFHAFFFGPEGRERSAVHTQKFIALRGR